MMSASRSSLTKVFHQSGEVSQMGNGTLELEKICK